MTTTELAFRHSLNTLTEHQPGTSKVFFWTITSRDILEKQEFTRRWNNFTRAIKRLFPKMPWLRVFELHPGEEGNFNGHGLHAHAIFPHFKRWELIDQVAKRVGLGRVHVKPLPLAQARNYLSKYLSKTKRADAPAILKFVRLWATINFPRKTRCKDVIRWTFCAWFNRRVGRNGNYRHMVKLIKNFSTFLAHRLQLIMSQPSQYKRFLLLNKFFIDNVFELAHGLQNVYNFDVSLSLGEDFTPLQVF